jgi:hypothetical protein
LFIDLILRVNQAIKGTFVRFKIPSRCHIKAIFVHVVLVL